jgi:hypothetical protein
VRIKRYFLRGLTFICFLTASCGDEENKQEYSEENTSVKNSGQSSSQNKIEEKTTDTLSREKKTVFSNAVKPEQTISPIEASDYNGRNVIVRGLVVDVYKNEKVAYLNFVEKYPKNPFTAVIFSSRFDDFGELEKYEGKMVEVWGIVSMYKGKPQIILNSKSQIMLSE